MASRRPNAEIYADIEQNLGPEAETIAHCFMVAFGEGKGKDAVIIGDSLTDAVANGKLRVDLDARCIVYHDQYGEERKLQPRTVVIPILRPQDPLVVPMIELARNAHESIQDPKARRRAARLSTSRLGYSIAIAATLLVGAVSYKTDNP